MSPDLQTAFSLLIIGMISVFIILFLVVMAGKGLIRLVNNYFPEPKDSSPIDIPKTIYRQRAISKAQIVAITAAVDAVTQGQGIITHIEKEK